MDQESNPKTVKVVWFICPLCKERFPSRNLFISHQINEHSAELKNSIKKTASIQSSGQTTETIFLRSESGKTVQLKVLKKSPPNIPVENPTQIETQNQNHLVNKIKKENEDDDDQIQIIDQKPIITEQKQDDGNNNNDDDDKSETRNSPVENCQEGKTRKYAVVRFNEEMPPEALRKVVELAGIPQVVPYLSATSSQLKTRRTKIRLFPKQTQPPKNVYGRVESNCSEKTVESAGSPSNTNNNSYNHRDSSSGESKKHTREQQSSPPQQQSNPAETKMEIPMALHMMNSKLPDNYNRKPTTTTTTTTKNRPTSSYKKSSSNTHPSSSSSSSLPLEPPSLKAIAVELSKRVSHTTSSASSAQSSLNIQNSDQEEEETTMDIKMEYEPHVEVILEEPDEFSDSFTTNQIQNEDDNNTIENIYEEYLYCSYCFQNFKSQATLDSHLLSCSGGNSNLVDENDDFEFNDNYTTNNMEQELANNVQINHKKRSHQSRDNFNYDYNNGVRIKKAKKEPGEVSPPPSPEIPLMKKKKKRAPQPLKRPSTKEQKFPLPQPPVKKNVLDDDSPLPKMVVGPDGKYYFFVKRKPNNNNDNSNNINNTATSLPPSTSNNTNNNNNSNNYNTPVSSASTKPQSSRRIAFRCVTCSCIFLSLSDLQAHKVIHSSAPGAISVANGS